MLATTEEIIEDIRQGRMVVLSDDEDRENENENENEGEGEGDMAIAADAVDAAAINFMATHARGLVCLTLTKAHCEHLGLKPMVASNGAQHSTNFTVSIDAAQGIDTGNSAPDRPATVHTAIAASACREDLVTPGHIFPLAAQPDGVLVRAGHTEAGCDLTRLPYARLQQ